MSEDKITEAVARAICKADKFAPEPDAPILDDMRECKAWEGRVGIIGVWLWVICRRETWAE